MPTNLLILPLLGGFIFLHVCHRFRRLLLESAIAATILLCFGRFVVFVLRRLPFGPSLQAAWDGFAPIPYLGTGTASLVLGLALALLFSLSNRKWYVGYIAEAWSLDPQEAYLRLLPILSGYRDPANLGIIPTTYYRPVYSRPGIEKDRFVIVIPLKDVEMANLFDENVYAEYFAPEAGKADSK